MAIDINRFSDSSPLITPELESQLGPLLDRINTPVSIVSIIGNSEKDAEMAAFLRHCARLCPSLSLKLLSPGEDIDINAALDAEYLPATGFIGESGLCRFAFHGVPGGKEITSFVSALLSAAGASRPLDKPTLKDIARISQPAHLTICVSLACHHCAQLVINAQRVAAENPLISAHMVDANLYPALVEKYHIEHVPVLLIDGEVASTGAMTLPELCTLLRKHR